MMNIVFKDLIKNMIEVYIDDMIVKTPEERDPIGDLERIFQQMREYKIRLNLANAHFELRQALFRLV